MLLPKHIAKTLLVLLIAICLNSVQAAVLEPTQDRDSIKNLLHWASKRKYNDINGAMTAINSAITIAKESNLTTSLFNIYRTQGYIFEQNSRPRDASSAYRNALLLQNVVNDSAKMDIYMDWAIVNKKLGNFKIAHEYYNYALIIAEQRDDKQIMSYAYNGIAQRTMANALRSMGFKATACTIAGASRAMMRASWNSSLSSASGLPIDRTNATGTQRMPSASMRAWWLVNRAAKVTR